MGALVYTGGTFDLFHAGHVNFLRQCNELGTVVVALNTDEFIQEFKGKPPIMTYKERYNVLAACIYVGGIVKNKSGADSKPTIEGVNPDIIAIGDDWKYKDYYKQMQFTQEWLDDRLIQLRYLPYTKKISSTIIKQRLKAQL